MQNSIKPKNRPICPYCGKPKARWEDKAGAQRFLDNLNPDEFKGEEIPIRAYKCRCGFWHVTHREDIKREVKLSELRPKYPLNIGIRYHLGNIIRHLDEAMIMLEREFEGDYITIKSEVHESLSLIYDLKISPYKDEMLSVQNLLFEFARDLYVIIDNSLSAKSWIETESIYEFIQDWKYYLSFLGYLKFFNKRVDNPRVKYILRNKDSFDEGNIYLGGLHCLRNYFVILNTGGNLPKCRNFYNIIEKMTDEILIEDLKELKENIPIL